MNEYIKAQLKLCSVAQIPEFDDSTTVINIPKGKRLSISDVAVGDYYLIELEDYIINPPPNFDLHINWNNNIKPVDKYLNCEIIQVMGKMIKVSGVGFNYLYNETTDHIWEGWLPRKSFKIIRRLD